MNKIADQHLPHAGEEAQARSVPGWPCVSPTPPSRREFFLSPAHTSAGCEDEVCISRSFARAVYQAAPVPRPIKDRRPTDAVQIEATANQTDSIMELAATRQPQVQRGLQKRIGESKTFVFLRGNCISCLFLCAYRSCMLEQIRSHVLGDNDDCRDANDIRHNCSSIRQDLIFFIRVIRAIYRLFPRAGPGILSFSFRASVL